MRFFQKKKKKKKKRKQRYLYLLLHFFKKQKTKSDGLSKKRAQRRKSEKKVVFSNFLKFSNLLKFRHCFIHCVFFVVLVLLLGTKKGEKPTTKKFHTPRFFSFSHLLWVLSVSRNEDIYSMLRKHTIYVPCPTLSRFFSLFAIRHTTATHRYFFFFFNNTTQHQHPCLPSPCYYCSKWPKQSY